MIQDINAHFWIMNSKQIFKVILAVGFIASFAQITIDIGDIPITGQTFAVLFIALIFNKLEAMSIILLYIILGTVGLPIFADGSSGIDKLLGNSGGFIIGFFVATFAVSVLKNKIQNLSLATIFLLTILGTVLIIICGLMRLSFSFGLEKALEYGFYPFWKGALIKIILGSFGVWFYNRITTRRLD